MEQAIKKRGFAVVEVISHCHTQFGAKNKLGDAVEMMRQQKAMAVRVDKARTMSPEELAGKITIGVLVDRDLPVYTEEYQKIRDAARAAMSGEIVQGSKFKVQSLRTSISTLNLEP